MITWATPYRPHAILNWSAGALQIVKPMRKITVPRWECMDASSNKKCYQDITLQEWMVLTIPWILWCLAPKKSTSVWDLFGAMWAICFCSGCTCAHGNSSSLKVLSGLVIVVHRCEDFPDRVNFMPLDIVKATWLNYISSCCQHKLHNIFPTCNACEYACVPKRTHV